MFMMGNLFNKWRLGDYINQVNNNLKKEIDKLTDFSNDEIESKKQFLVKKYKIELLELLEPKPMIPNEVMISRKNAWGETVKQKFYEINVNIEFNGDKDLFYCIPSTTHTVVYLDSDVSINHNCIVAKLKMEKLDESKYNIRLNKIVKDLSENIPKINIELSAFNLGLESTIENFLKQRIAINSEKNDFMKKIQQ